MMMSRRFALRRLLSTPTAAGVSLLAVSSLAGCEDNVTPLPVVEGGRNSNENLQRDMEIPPGIPRLEKTSHKKKRR
jgi:hypothetical protein